MSSIVVVSNQPLSVDFIRVYVFKQQVIHKKKRFPTIFTLQGTTNKKMEQKLSNLNEVDEMIVLVVRTDGDEELFERSLLSGGKLPGCHVKS